LASGTSDNVAIELRGLGYTYPDGTEGLRGIDLTIHRGERVGFIGPNGAGKSTLLLHLNGIRRGDGEVRIFGEGVNDRTIRDIRARVGFVFQDAEDQLFCPTVFDDVAFGPLNWRYPKEEIRERVTRALQRVGMEGSEERSAFHLSGGEQKRIALATVLSLDPEILVLDEPSGGLDPRTRRRLIELLQTFDTTLIIATHDLDMVLDLCERCVVLHHGRIVADGTSPHLLHDEELLLRYDLELPLSIRGR
jgi:cobalt/nickel transport system ATP-binding protein